jgi:transcriptional regulator with XRE-family HTH domain
MTLARMRRDQYRQACLRSLGQHIRHLRLSRDVSQLKLATLSGLTPNFIDRVEAGVVEPGAIVLVRLSQSLDVSIEAIVEPLRSLQTTVSLAVTDHQHVDGTNPHPVAPLVTPPTTTTLRRRGRRRQRGIAHARRTIKRNRAAVELFFAQRAPADNSRRANHGALVEAFVKHGSYTICAGACGVTPERVRQLVCAAMRYLRKRRLA